jgi:hypothetical protein
MWGIDCNEEVDLRVHPCEPSPLGRSDREGGGRLQSSRWTPLQLGR